MRNLEAYLDNSFEFYEDVVGTKRNTKRDSKYLERVSLLNKQISVLFKGYDTQFTSNNLVSITPYGYENQEKKDLLALYSYRNRILQSLVAKVSRITAERILKTCQSCTINEANTLDHILPKDYYAEFSVHPKNLIPSCSKCNGHKGTNWKSGNTNLFLNLYLDQLPSVDYLFVTTTIESNTVKAEFRVENINGIQSNLFELIRSHYTRLKLIERFSSNIDSVVEPLKNELEVFKGKIPISEFQNIVIERNRKNRTSFGQNYWKSVLEDELIMNDDFINL